MSDSGTISLISSGVGGMAIGFVIGFGIKKALKAVIKIAAVIIGIFFGVLIWMQTQGFLTLHWEKITAASSNSVTGLANATLAVSGINGTETVGGNFLNQIVASLGVPMTGGLAIGFTFGIMRG